MIRISTGNIIILAAVLFVFAICASPATAQQQKNASRAGASDPPASAAQASTATSGYVGSQVCETCHEDIYKNWETSPHWKTTLNKAPSHQGCEACHGPGQAHVASGGDTTKIYDFTKHTAEQIDKRCLSCHAGSKDHMNDLHSIHAENGVSCISCHSIHHATTAEYFLAKAQPTLCYQCHLAQKAEFSMPFRHRVNAGLIQCTDCHNPHGTEGPNQLRNAATLDAVCMKCHTDKQGPFVYEHPPVKVEGCTACHLVHGGPNPHMLKVSNVNLLCLQCHTTSSFSPAPGAPVFHNQATFFQSCILCHSQIHGSNYSPFFFQ